MAVILLVGTANRFLQNIEEFFRDSYEVVKMTTEFKTIRSELSNQENSKLYIVPNLSKPERYEIFCVTRKNEQFFLTIADKEKDDSSVSDRNVIAISSFNGEEIRKKLLNSKLAPTTANKRSKSVSLKSVGELKILINKINTEYTSYGNIDVVLSECEERLIKIWNFNTKSTIEEAEECYRSMVYQELKNKGLYK